MKVRRQRREGKMKRNEKESEPSRHNGQHEGRRPNSRKEQCPYGRRGTSEAVAVSIGAELPTSGGDGTQPAVGATSCIPPDWKEACVVLARKPGQPIYIASPYRSVSLTSYLAKLMERMIYGRLSWFLGSR